MKRKAPDGSTKGTGPFGRNSTFKAKDSAAGKASAAAKKSPPSERDRVKRAAINALKKARRVAARTGVTLSEWEDDFLGSVADRIKTYGRAFGDADKGDLSAPLSVMQGRKLKEIARKAKGESPAPKPRRGFRRRTPEPEG